MDGFVAYQSRPRRWPGRRSLEVKVGSREVMYPRLSQALKLPDLPAARVAALEVLLALLPAHDPAHPDDPSSEARPAGVAAALEGQLGTLVPALLACCRPGPGDLVGRCRSLECLRALPAVLPFQSLFPFKREVRGVCGAAARSGGSGKHTYQISRIRRC